MNNTNEIIKRLNFENYIWGVFIVIAILNIYGDELIKKSVLENNEDINEQANKLFLMITLISILIYVYFFYRNYIDYKNYHNKSYQVRLIGSILILAGTFCFLYFQLTTNINIDSASNI